MSTFLRKAIAVVAVTATLGCTLAATTIPADAHHASWRGHAGWRGHPGWGRGYSGGVWGGGWGWGYPCFYRYGYPNYGCY